MIYHPISTCSIDVLTKIDKNSPEDTVKMINLYNNHYMPLIERNHSYSSNDGPNNLMLNELENYEIGRIDNSNNFSRNMIIM